MYNLHSNNKLLNKPFLNNFEPITFNDILEAISKLKNGSSGIDQIASELLKKDKTIFCIPKM